MGKHKHKHQIASVTPISNGNGPKPAAEQNNIPPRLAEALAIKEAAERKPVTMADVIPESAVTQLGEGMAAWSGQVHADHEATSPASEQHGPTPAPDTMAKHAQEMEAIATTVTKQSDDIEATAQTVAQEIAATVAAMPPRPHYINLRWQEFTDDCGLRWHAFKHSMRDGYVVIAAPSKALWSGFTGRVKRANDLIIVNPVKATRRNVNHFFALRGRAIIIWTPIVLHAAVAYYIAYHFLMKWW